MSVIHLFEGIGTQALGHSRAGGGGHSVRRYWSKIEGDLHTTRDLTGWRKVGSNSIH